MYFLIIYKYMGRKLLIFFTGLLFLLPVYLSAQTAAELEAMLQTQAVTNAQAAKFVLASAEAEANISAENAFQQALSNGWLKKDAKSDSEITLSRLSFLMMKAFNIKGGMMYSIAPGPRYAYKSMVSRNYIQGASDPGMNVDGERLLLILGKVISAEGGE